jgi:hypothetical protein
MGSGYEIARAVEACIATGHPPAVAWKYTPRQLAGWAELSYRRRSGELAELLMVTAAGQAGGKGVTKLLKTLQTEAL